MLQALLAPQVVTVVSAQVQPLALLWLWLAVAAVVEVAPSLAPLVAVVAAADVPRTALPGQQRSVSVAGRVLQPLQSPTLLWQGLVARLPSSQRTTVTSVAAVVVGIPQPQPAVSAEALGTVAVVVATVAGRSPQGRQLPSQQPVGSPMPLWRAEVGRQGYLKLPQPQEQQELMEALPEAAQVGAEAVQQSQPVSLAPQVVPAALMVVVVVVVDVDITQDSAVQVE